MPALKDKLNSKRLIENMTKILESEQCIRAENRIFKFVGVTPHEKKYRDSIDWLYLLLWASSIIYQFMLLFCFFIYPPPYRFSDLLGLFYDTYIMAVAGYGIFNAFYHYYPDNRRQANIKIDRDKERRKRRNGHRFIMYWWMNFLTMLSASIFFGYSTDLSGPLGISLKTAMSCSGIGFGYWYWHWHAKNK